MANYSILKAAIAQVIKTNGNNEITGNLLQQQLFSMVNTLGTGYQCMGVAVLTPTPTNPGTPDANVFYIASEPGTYANFGNIVINDGEVCLLTYNGTWSKRVTGAATASQLNQLGQEVKETYGDYVENSEWLKVVTDDGGRILYGVKTDGKFYFGDGCPPQVQEYVLLHKAEILLTLNEKVDKENGKSLIDEFFASSQMSVDNSEWEKVITDKDGRILEGIKKGSGVHCFFAGVEGISPFDPSQILNLSGKKLVTIGDSLTANLIWQPRLAKFSGMVWSAEETASGVGYVNINDGTYTTEDKSGDANYRKAYRMAKGGTPLKPSSVDSIYIRSTDAKFYNPDIIIIYGGENDALNTWKSAGNPGTTPEEIVENETPYLDGVVDSSVSAISAYKGMIERLQVDCPHAIIYIVSSMRVYGEVGKNPTGIYEHSYPHPRFATFQDVIDWEDSDRFPRVQYMREIAKLYNLPLIDLWSLSGINDYNASSWYPATADDCTQVHPNNDGYYRMADIMLRLI